MHAKGAAGAAPFKSKYQTVPTSLMSTTSERPRSVRPCRTSTCWNNCRSTKPVRSSTLR